MQLVDDAWHEEEGLIGDRKPKEGRPDELALVSGRPRQQCLRTKTVKLFLESWQETESEKHSNDQR